MNRVFTISAAVAPSLSASSCGEAPRGTLTAAACSSAAGAAGTSMGTGAASGISSTTWTSVDTCPLPSSSASWGRRVGSCSAVAALGLLPGFTWPRAARIRGTASSGTVEEAVRPS